MAENLSALGDHIAAKLGPAVTGHTVAFGELTIDAEAAGISAVLTFLRDDPECRFVCFIDICGADYPAREKRFDVVYHLLSPYKNQRIRVKVQTDEDTQVPAPFPYFQPPTGMSAKPSISTACCSPITRTCAVF